MRHPVARKGKGTEADVENDKVLINKVGAVDT